VIRNPRAATRKQRYRIQVNLAAAQLYLTALFEDGDALVRNAAPPEARHNQVCAVIVAAHFSNAVLPRQSGDLIKRGVRVERRALLPNGINDQLLTLNVANRPRKRVAPAA